MKSIYTLVGAAFLGAILVLSAGTATATDFDQGAWDKQINDSLYNEIDRA